MKNNLGYLQENAGATTQELWNGCLFDKRALFLNEGYSPLTLKTYCFQYNLLLRFFGDIDMDELTTEKLKGYRLLKGLPFSAYLIFYIHAEN
jgi:hypothetical protein